ncbi:MAG: LamG domain-containing protein [Phycisphaerae bacterium]|nr:LamG domain-containing protein [Phycisphaerae bacterium]
MCRKLLFLMLVLAFALTVPIQGATIIWVSDDKADDGTDQGWIDMLVLNGYTVSLDFRTRQGRTLDAAEIDALNAADLVIFSRDTSSGEYNGATEIAQWNGITTPLICVSAYQYRSSRWKWMDSTSTSATTANLLAVIPDHPIFEGVTLDGSNQVSILTAQSNVGDNNVDPTTNYTLIATRSDSGADGVWIAFWEPGVEFYPGSGQVAGGPRMYFAAGGSEGDNIDGRYNLTSEGEKLCLNAVEYMLNWVQTRATEPDPEDGAAVPPAGEFKGKMFMILSFEAGETAVAHTAYFSEDFDDVSGRVEDVNLGSPPWPVYMPTSYYVGYDDANLPACARAPLATGIPYHWVVDETDGDGVTHAGDVWSFVIMPEQVWGPSPGDGEENVIGDPEVTLSWQLGDVDEDDYARIIYEVYYGTDLADVNAGTSPDAQVEDTTHPIGPLASETVHYWRVDTRLVPNNPVDPIVRIKGDVWSFRTLLVVPVVDPHLIGWWKLDGGFGDLVFDYSGHANHGTARSDPQTVAGHDANALEFDGADDYVAIDNLVYNSTGLPEVTVAAWIRTSDAGDQVIASFDRNEYWRLEINGNGAGAGQVGWGIMTDAGQIDIGSSIRVDDGEWHHVAGVFDNGTAIAYVDGANDAEAANGTTYGSGTTRFGYLCVGSESSAFDGSKGPTNYFGGTLDDVRIYDRALSAQEMKVLAGRLEASGPNPPNEWTDVSRTPTLSWQGGAYMGSFHGNLLYLSQDMDEVINRTSGTPLTETSFEVTTQLDLGKTYYWAVDTVNDLFPPGDIVWPGAIWKFTTINYLVIDDMAPYVPYDNSAGPHIFVAWRDGKGDCDGSGNETGANLLETTPVFAGSQVMQYDWDNDGLVDNPCTGAEDDPRPYYYSKIEAQVAGLPSGIGSNWTIEGVKALSLQFYGDPANSTNDPLWVQLSDGSGPGEKVEYGAYADESLADIQDPDWHEWLIDLADFNVQLTNVVSIAIGVGDENATGPHISSGTLYIDDVRLYTPQCIPSRNSADFAMVDFAPDGAPDCVVDYKELKIMTRDWLLTDILDTGELLVHWKFDDAVGTTAIDSSIHGRNGVISDTSGASWVDDPDRGWCLDFSDGDFVLDNDANAYMNGLRGLTVAVWVKNREIAATDKGFIIFADPAGNDNRDMRYDAAGASTQGTSLIKCGTTSGGPSGGIQEYESISGTQTTAWQHLAMTWSSGNDVKLYIDGVEDTTGAVQATRTGTTTGYTQMVVGQGGKFNDASGGGWNGLIDDVQIYNYALSGAEIATVKAGGTIPPKALHYPVPSPAEIYEGEDEGERAINFKDYAVLMANWLREGLYPQ